MINVKEKNNNKRYTDQMILVEYRYVCINVRIIRCDSIYMRKNTF